MMLPFTASVDMGCHQGLFWYQKSGLVYGELYTREVSPETIPVH